MKKKYRDSEVIVKFENIEFTRLKLKDIRIKENNGDSIGIKSDLNFSSIPKALRLSFEIPGKLEIILYNRYSDIIDGMVISTVYYLQIYDEKIKRIAWIWF